ncbi:MAG: beta strand repeat-containing protein, partial [Kiritimatiellia bacterium]
QTTVSQNVRTSSGWDAPYAEDHYIVQDYVQTRTLTTITTIRTFEQYEQALGGYDWEIGLRLPIRSADLEARLFGGYYDFDRDFGAAARGWKTRAEVRVRSSLYLDAGLYENEDLTGSDWFAGARWSTPLDLGQLARGRNPFGAAKARLRGEPRAASARLTEMVLRDPQIRLEQSKFLENPELTTEQIARKVDEDREPHVLLPDVQFVDGDAASSGDGAADSPFASIQQAADAVYGTRNVYVFAAAAPYEENVVLLPDTTLWGSGVLIPGFGGQFFGSGVAPVVDGMDRGPTVTMVDNTAIQGFQIQNTYQGLAPVLYEGPVANAVAIRDVSRVGILGDNAAHLIIQNNVIAGNETGVYIERLGDFDLRFANNVAANNSDPHDYGADGFDRSASGLEIYGEGNSGLFDVAIVDSVFGGNAAHGALIDAGTYDASIVAVQDSDFLQNAFSGLALFQGDTGDAQALFASVQADDNGSGLFVAASGAGTSLVSLQDVSANGNVGLGVGIVQTESATALAEIADTTASDTGADGFLIVQSAGGTALTEVSGSAAVGNAGNGLLVLQTENDLAQADVVETAAAGNAGIGIELVQTMNALATVRVADSQASANGAAGLLAIQDGAELAVAAIGGLQADGNGDGIVVQQADVGVALANLSGSGANANVGNGIQLAQISDGASIGVIGMPDGLAASIGDLADLAGLTLPDEIAPFFGPSGAVTANGNGAAGVESMVISEGLFALNGLFDVTANGNAGNGATAITVAPDGLALGLAGSSENWGEIFQLATQVGDLFDVDLPLALAGAGHMQVNDNGANGLFLATLSDFAAVNAALGVEAVGNAGMGAAVIADAGVLALNAVARLDATDNGVLGLGLFTYGEDLAAVSLLADVNASNNGTAPLLGGGIYSQTISPNGAAVLLGLSTDALRPLAAVLGENFLGAPFELPGEPFGPIVASGNDGFGIQAVVQGDFLAAAALLDVQADDNAADGIDLTLASPNGTTVSLLASTDLLYDVLPEALGADPIPGAGLGPVSASGNGGSGIVIEQIGAGPAFSVLAGVDANNNAAGDGILATLASDSSTVGAFLVDVQADGNAAGRGVDLDLTGFDDVLAGLVFVDADDNGQQGIRLTGTSANADAAALLAGIDADRNGALGNQAGLVVDLTAAGDASAALTDVYAWNNVGRGANVLLDAGADANLFVGDFAADDLDALYGFSWDIGPLFDLVPAGNVSLSENGSGGLNAELTSANGDALVGISGVNADNNGNMGYNLTLTALNGNAIAGIEWAYANNNGGNGLSLALNGAGGVADVLLNRVGVTGNGGNGIQILENYNGAVSVIGERLVATGNTGNGVRLAMSGLGGAPILDFGGGADSAGQSSFFGNGNRDFRYNNGGGATVMAENNWWGVAAPVAGQFAGSIDYVPALAADPNAP